MIAFARRYVMPIQNNQPIL